MSWSFIVLGGETKKSNWLGVVKIESLSASSLGALPNAVEGERAAGHFLVQDISPLPIGRAELSRVDFLVRSGSF